MRSASGSAPPRPATAAEAGRSPPRRPARCGVSCTFRAPGRPLGPVPGGDRDGSRGRGAPSRLPAAATARTTRRPYPSCGHQGRAARRPGGHPGPGAGPSSRRQMAGSSAEGGGLVVSSAVPAVVRGWITGTGWLVRPRRVCCGTPTIRSTGGLGCPRRSRKRSGAMPPCSSASATAAATGAGELADPVVDGAYTALMITRFPQSFDQSSRSEVKTITGAGTRSASAATRASIAYLCPCSPPAS